MKYLSYAVKVVQNYVRSEIIAEALKTGDMSRMELVNETGIKRTTVNDHLVRLLIDGKVTRYKIKKRGRPIVMYKLMDQQI